MGPLIVNYVVFFPLLLPILEERPLEFTDLQPGPYPVVYSEQQIKLQRQGLSLADRELRLVICRELRQTNREDAFEIIRDQLPKEKEPKLIAGILAELSMTPYLTPDMASMIEPYLGHDSADVRYWAAEAYGRLGAAPRPLIQLLREDDSDTVRAVAAERLAADHPQVPLDVFMSFWANDEDSSVLSSAVVGACRRSDAGSAVDAVVAQLDGWPVAARFGLAQSLDVIPETLRRELVHPLSDDPSASVRGELAAALGRIGNQAFLPILLGLCADPDPEARRRAVIACRVFPSPEVRAAYVERLGDPRTLVRRAAEEALVAMHDQVPVAEAVFRRLRDPLPYVRYHVCRVLGRVNAKRYEEDVHTLLKSEDRDVNIGAAVFALGQFGTRTAAPTIASKAGHPAPVVRVAVAEALGKLAVPATYTQQKVLAFDQEEAVRQAAIIGMGVTGDGQAFNATILKVLKTVNEEVMTPENRAAAGRAAAFMRPLDPALMTRVKVQATVPVVPGDMGEMLFEEDHVLATMAFTLALWGQENEEARKLFQEAHKMHSFVLAPGDMPPPGVALVPSPEINEAARQALACLEGRTPEKARRPTTERRFSYDVSRRIGGN